jgi:hypothetical protein
MGSNNTNLIANWRWHGLGFDGDAAKIRGARRWYSRNRSTMFDPPRMQTAIVSEKNVNELLGEHEFGNDVDVLSIDIDGIDYWVWKALDATPRVVVIEFNCCLPADRAVTVPVRDPITSLEDRKSQFAGASLAALVKLANTKGYRFVGGSAGVNAFFVLESEIPSGLLPAASVQESLARLKPAGRHPLHNDPTLLSRPWVEV